MMRVLVLSNVPWDTRNSYGNTLSNWFEGWDEVEFYNVYCRSSLPVNDVCKHYYTVPPLSLIKSFFRPSKIGFRFSTGDNKAEMDSEENSLIQSVQQGNKEWVYLISDLAYSTGIWKTKFYKQFIKEANPDIFFSFGIADSFMYENYCYIKKHTNAKIVTFVADDVYGAYLNSQSLRGSLQATRFSKMIEMSDHLYGASEELCGAYQKIFKKNFSPLYKGCISISNEKQDVNDPIRIIYAGNLLWGRDAVLSEVVNSLEEINADGIKACLEIYTGSARGPEVAKKLNKGASSRICGRLAYDEIVKIQNCADVLLQVESFDKHQIDIVKYSFSTKIIDCLQAGGTMLVIGPSGISSVEYSRRIPGVIVIDDLNNLTNTLRDVFINRMSLVERSKKIRKFAIKYHSISNIRDILKNEFIKLVQGNEYENFNNRKK